MGLRGLAPTWAQDVEGGVTVRGSAQGVKSTSVIHTLLHLAVILAGDITMSGSLEYIIQQQHAVWITPVTTVLHNQIDPSAKTCSVLMHHQ